MVDPLADPFQLVLVRIALAFGVGALIGLEREQSESGGTFAGSRTFPLFALLGALAGAFYPAAFPVLLLAVALPLTVAYGAKVVMEGDIGLTTLTTALLTVVLGALVTHSERGALLAVVVAGAVTVILAEKGAIHRFVNRIDDQERRASVTFILVAFVVYPVLPDRDVPVLFGLNPRFVWLMVVFVTGLSFAAYVLSRVFGARRGIAVTGVFGGFVSSTATTVSMAERATDSPVLYRVCAFSTVVASIVMFPRALLEVAVVNRSLAPDVVVPLGLMTGVGIVVAAAVYWRAGSAETAGPDVENPFRLRPALFFGIVFAAVLLVSEHAHEWFGASGIYATAFLSGLADVDAITVTLSRLSADGAVSQQVATTGIVIGAVANTLVKAGLTWVIGTRKLAILVTAVLGIVSGVGLLYVVLV